MWFELDHVDGPRSTGKQQNGMYPNKKDVKKLLTYHISVSQAKA